MAPSRRFGGTIDRPVDVPEGRRSRDIYATNGGNRRIASNAALAMEQLSIDESIEVSSIDIGGMVLRRKGLQVSGSTQAGCAS